MRSTLLRPQATSVGHPKTRFALGAAQSIEDIGIPGYRLHRLRGGRKGIWSITVSGNWRITFEFKEGNVYGEFIQGTYLEPFGLSGRYLAERLDVAASTLNRVLKRQSGISPEMALRLSKSLGRSPESWLAMQDAYDLWQAKKNVKLGNVQKVKLNAA